MRHLQWERPIFKIASRSVTFREVLAGAGFRGDLNEAWERAHWLSQTDLSMVNEEAVQARSETFRMAHDLITGEETERWLEARGLTLEDFGNYLAWQEVSPPSRGAAGASPKSLTRANLRGAPPCELSGLESASEDVREILRVDLQLSGKFDQLAEAFAWRLAAASGMTDERGTRPDDFQTMEVAFQKQCDAVLTESALRQAWSEMRLPFTRLELECLEVESHDAAREALLCVREDGLSLRDIALEGGYVWHQVTSYFDDLPGDLQSRLLSLRPGDCVPPEPVGEGFRIWRLLCRTNPGLSDDDLRRRLNALLIRRHFTQLTANTVQWLPEPQA